MSGQNPDIWPVICLSLQMPNGHSPLTNAAFIVCNYWPSYDKDELPIYKTQTQSQIQTYAVSVPRIGIMTATMDCAMVCENSAHKCAKDYIIRDGA